MCIQEMNAQMHEIHEEYSNNLHQFHLHSIEPELFRRASHDGLKGPLIPILLKKPIEQKSKTQDQCSRMGEPNRHIHVFKQRSSYTNDLKTADPQELFFDEYISVNKERSKKPLNHTFMKTTLQGIKHIFKSSHSTSLENECMNLPRMPYQRFMKEQSETPTHTASEAVHCTGKKAKKSKPKKSKSSRVRALDLIFQHPPPAKFIQLNIIY
jgi:hypothetical protein